MLFYFNLVHYYTLSGVAVPECNSMLNREVFQCPVLISPWRIRHAWHKNLMKKCPDIEKRSMMAKRLGELICNICRGNGGMELFEAFLEDFVDCAGFLDYFRALWFPRLGWSMSLSCITFA